MDQVGWLW